MADLRGLGICSVNRINDLSVQDVVLSNGDNLGWIRQAGDPDIFAVKPQNLGGDELHFVSVRQDAHTDLSGVAQGEG